MLRAKWLLIRLAFILLPLVLASCAGSVVSSKTGWSTRFDGGCFAGTTTASEPVIDDGVIFIGSQDGGVYAFDATTGERKWRFHNDIGMPGGPQIIVAPRGSSASEMLGEALARQNAAGAVGRQQVSASPLVKNQTVYIGSWDHHFYAIDALTGKQNWSFFAGLPIAAGAVAHDDKIIFVTSGRNAAHDKGDGQVYALRADDGSKAWVFDTLPGVEPGKKWPSHMPLINNGVAYITNWDGKAFEKGSVDSARVFVSAVDASSGHVRWSRVLDGAWPSPPAITQGQLFFATRPRGVGNVVQLHALDAVTGETAWRYETSGGADFWHSISDKIVLRAPVVSDDIVFLATDLEIVALDATTGRERWRLDKPPDSTAVRGIASGNLLYAVTQNDLYAYDPLTGKPVWSVRLGRIAAVNRMLSIWLDRIIDDVLFVGVTAWDLIAVDSRSGERIGRVSLGMFGGSNPLCSGPVQFGNQLIVTTSRYESMGSAPQTGRLLSIDAPWIPSH